MGVNFLGEEKNGEKDTTKEVIELYIPHDEPEIKENKRKKKKKKDEEPEVEAKEYVDLADEYQRKVQTRKALVLILVVILLVVGAVYGGSTLTRYLTTRPVTVPDSTVVVQEPSGGEVVSSEDEVPVEPTQPPPTEPGVLPDTELAALRGALITFRDSDALYLVEENGELRLIIQDAVIFDNGQRLQEINRALIYLLPDTWKNTRRGSQSVTGQVDFDPRVLSFQELRPFIQ